MTRTNTPTTTRAHRRGPGMTAALFAATAAVAAFGFVSGPAASPGPLHLVADESADPAASCDVAALATNLTEDPQRAAAWAGVRGIAPEDAGSFFVTLSPAPLDSDATFTHFSYADGSYMPEEAEFPAGTEVLVDGDGLPAATCDLGDPLTTASDEQAPAPEEGPGPEYQPDMGEPAPDMGPQDPGYDPMHDPGHEPMQDPMHDPMHDPGHDGMHDGMHDPGHDGMQDSGHDPMHDPGTDGTGRPGDPGSDNPADAPDASQPS